MAKSKSQTKKTAPPKHLRLEVRQKALPVRKGRFWVSKTDLIRFYKCAYAFWLIDKGEVNLDDILGELQVDIMNRGLAFEREVVVEAVPIQATVEAVPKLLKTRRAVIFDLPVLENKASHIYGKPDGVDTRHGALIPIEVKWHGRPRYTDMLELAFYWILLEPYQSRKAKPRGMLYLRSETGVENFEVEIRDTQIERVRWLIEGVRRARRRGVEPSWCTCEVCVTRPEVREVALAMGGATLIYGVAGSRSKALASLGIRRVDDFLACDEDTVVTGLRTFRHFVSAAQVREWKHHATSYRSGAPVFFGTDLLDIDSFLVIDCEYDSASPGSIFLIGAAAVDNGDIIVEQWWADSQEEVKANILGLLRFLKRWPHLPVLTWCGDSAEMIELAKAAQIHEIEEELAVLVDRHRDLFRFAERNVRLPIPTLDLKEVANYFHIPRKSEISHGMEAVSKWLQYRRTRSKVKKESLRRALLEYNRDDLEALAEIARHLRALALARSRDATPTKSTHTAPQ